MYTVTIGGIGGDGTAPYYTEPCAATIAVAFSSWDRGTGSTGVGITTTDLYNGCELRFFLLFWTVSRQIFSSCRPSLVWHLSLKPCAYWMPIAALRFDVML